MHPLDHPVSRYAASVVAGDVTTGDLVRMACERHLMDLETGRDRGLYFDCEAANMICNFAGMLQHTKGPLAGKPLTLQPWQEFRHGSVFGWKREDTGLRRFRDTYHQVGKKGGKRSFAASATSKEQREESGRSGHLPIFLLCKRGEWRQ